jgi:hypothetical protein
MWECIDGNKRLNAIKDFKNDAFPLEADIYEQKVSGLYYSEIKLYIVSRFEQYPLLGYVINPTDTVSKVEIIKRIKMF